MHAVDFTLPTPDTMVRSGSEPGIAPTFLPGYNWVCGRELDARGTHLQLQLRNNAMAPTWPAGTCLTAREVLATGPLSPGLYLVRWPIGTLDHWSYVARLTEDGISSEQLSFCFDGELPEPIVHTILRRRSGPMRLYQVQAL